MVLKGKGGKESLNMVGGMGDSNFQVYPREDPPRTFLKKGVVRGADIQSGPENDGGLKCFKVFVQALCLLPVFVWPEKSIKSRLTH